VASLEFSTAIGAANTHQVTVRGHDLVEDLIGELTYTETALLAITGRRPTPGETRVVDAVLVSLMDHGMQPSALAARMTYHVAPEAVQAAVAAGLLGAGSLLLGSVEQAGEVLSRIRDAVAGGAAPEQAVDDEIHALRAAGRRIPGLGHALHSSGDPRAAKLLAVARREQVAQHEISLLEHLVARARAVTGRDLPLNVSGAAAALLLGVGLPWRLHRGFALISRCAGLVAHVGEEADRPVTPAVRDALRQLTWIDA